jgi:hypothetical protein
MLPVDEILWVEGCRSLILYVFTVSLFDGEEVDAAGLVPGRICGRLSAKAQQVGTASQWNAAPIGSRDRGMCQC